MSDSLSQINEYLDLLFVYGPFWVYLAIFCACFIENLLPPFPGDSFIVVGGGLVAAVRMDFLFCFLTIITGGMCSVMIVYFLGRRYGREFFVRRDYKFLPATDIYRMEASFRRWGALVLIFSRFVVGARTVLALVAGIGRYPSPRMFIFSLISYVLFTGLLMYIGIALVENFELIQRYFDTYNLIVWPVLTLIVLYWLVRKIRKIKKESQA